MTQPQLQETPIEAVQAFWNAHPYEIQRSKKAVGTRDYFKEVENRRYLIEPHIPDFADFGRWRDATVLELGCGIGTDAINFGRAGARVMAVDLSEASASLAEQRAEVFGLEDRITFVLGNGEILADYLEPSCFDLAYAFGVINHTPNPERALKELRRLIKPGGKLKIMVYHRHSLRVLAIILWKGFGRFWRSDDLVTRHASSEPGCPVTYVYSRKQGRRLVEDAGFRVTRVAVDYIFPYRKSAEVNHNYVRKLTYRLIPRFVFRALERRFGWHLMIEAEA
jgi:ubiquinone/menaquinone biosynthesis C-methylase UbiE